MATADQKYLFTGDLASLISSGGELSDTEGELSGPVTVQSGEPLLWCELVFTMGVSAPAKSLNIFVVRSMDDGVTYEQGASGTPATAPGHPPDAFVMIESGTSSQKHTFFVQCPPAKLSTGYAYFKLLVVNESGQSVSSGWTLKTRPATYRSDTG